MHAAFMRSLTHRAKCGRNDGDNVARRIKLCLTGNSPPKLTQIKHIVFLT